MNQHLYNREQEKVSICKFSAFTCSYCALHYHDYLLCMLIIVIDTINALDWLTDSELKDSWRIYLRLTMETDQSDTQNLELCSVYWETKEELHKPFSLHRPRHRRQKMRKWCQLLLKALHLPQQQDKDAEVVDADDEVAAAAAGRGMVLPLAIINSRGYDRLIWRREIPVWQYTHIAVLNETGGVFNSSPVE